MREAKRAIKDEVRRSHCYSVFDLDWDSAFRAVKNRLRLSDWQQMADITKEALSKLGSEERSQRYKEKHREYIYSDLWSKRSKNFLRQQDCTCEDCGGKAEEAHHTSYRNFAAENAEDEFRDLVALCSRCHKRRHYEKGDFY